MDLNRDPRWKRVHHRPWKCACCGGEHQGLMEFARRRPCAWPSERVVSPETGVYVNDSNFLNLDVCVMDAKIFHIRGTLPLPIVGADGRVFSLGVWATLSGEDFDTYATTFSEDQSQLGPWSGALANNLPGYPPSMELGCEIGLQPLGKRPTFHLAPSDHPLAVHQRDGVSFDEILEFYAHTGHDIRPSLKAH